jgi:hypothetical protein
VDPVAARPPVPLRPVAAPVAEPVPPAPAVDAGGGDPGAGAPSGEQPPPLPVSLQREQMRPPTPPLMTEEQMVALLSAALNGPPPVHAFLDLSDTTWS